MPYEKYTLPLFLQEVQYLVSILRKKSSEELSELMGISSELAELNHHRYQNWQKQFNPKTARQAIFTFNGPVYHGFDFIAYKKADFERLQEQVRILSGLFGLLRPFDLIQAHRLEMSTQLPNSAGNDLYSFWRKKVTDSLNKECKDILVNCASKEYADAIDFSKLDCKVITPLFKNYKNGKYQVIGLLAKKARGLFADFVVKNNIKNPEGLKKFNASGYQFDTKSSTDSEFVFLRK